MACLLYPPETAVLPLPLPPQTAEDLQLGRLAAAMSPSDYYRLNTEDLCALFSDAPDILRWRQEVFRDVLLFPELEGAMEDLLDALDGGESRGSSRRGADSFAVGFSLDDFTWLDGYLRKTERAWRAFSGIPLKSRGFRALTGLLGTMCDCPRYKTVAEGFRSLCAGYSAPAKMRLGYNLDDELRPERLKLLSMTASPESGRTRTPAGRRMMLTQRAVESNAMLLQRVSAQASQDISSFVLRETSRLRGLRKELIICLAVRKLIRSWEDAGLPYTFPLLTDPAEKRFRARSLFDPLLLLSGRERIIANDIEFRPGGEILFLTGANQGGKTVFLLSIGLCQLLAQLGFPVPAQEAELSTAKNILTIFAPNGQRYGSKGLLAEEAGRIACAVDALSPGSMVLFNEPLTGTGPEETCAISAEVVAVCMAAGARGIWVTHVHKLAAGRSELEKAVSWGSRLGSLRVVLEEAANDGPRFTYLVERGEPSGFSHADEALRRGGVQL